MEQRPVAATLVIRVAPALVYVLIAGACTWYWLKMGPMPEVPSAWLGWLRLSHELSPGGGGTWDKVVP